MRLVIVLLTLLSTCVGSADAHQTLLDASCKQGTCYHTLLRNFEAPLILKNGMLRRYESSFVARRCKADEAMDNADCRVKRPALDEFKSFTRSYALCSLSNPTIVSMFLGAPDAKPSYVASFLDVAGNIPAYQEAWTLEYLVVCHDWEPHVFDDQFARTIAALGYRPSKTVTDTKQFASESDVLAFLNQEVAGNPFSPSLHALEGKWFLDDARICKGNPGEAEGLLTFKGSKFIGYESECAIGSSRVSGRILQLQMRCSGEGMVSRETEQIEFLSDRQIRRTVADGKKRYSSVHTRCP
jgi:hypothetical protein